MPVQQLLLYLYVTEGTEGTEGSEGTEGTEAGERPIQTFELKTPFF